jgi:biopolymer transport protein ExbB/TolQ
LGVAAVIATRRVVRRVWKNKERASLAAKLVVLLAVAGATYGALGTVVGMLSVYGAIGGQSVDPSQKARVLAEGISEAMNCTAFALLVWVPSIVMARFLSRGVEETPPQP